MEVLPQHLKTLKSTCDLHTRMRSFPIFRRVAWIMTVGQLLFGGLCVNAEDDIGIWRSDKSVLSNKAHAAYRIIKDLGSSLEVQNKLGKASEIDDKASSLHHDKSDRRIRLRYNFCDGYISIAIAEPRSRAPYLVDVGYNISKNLTMPSSESDVNIVLISDGVTNTLYTEAHSVRSDLSSSCTNRQHPQNDDRPHDGNNLTSYQPTNEITR